VTPDKESWELVPGKLLKAYNDEHPFLRKTLTEQQQTEYVRYQPCSICGARRVKIVARMVEKADLPTYWLLSF